jgi:hypothetical protein
MKRLLGIALVVIFQVSSTQAQFPVQHATAPELSKPAPIVQVTSTQAQPQLQHATVSELWTPASKPAVCETLHVDTVVFDVSRSMAKDQLLEKTKQQVIDYMSDLRPCTLFIVARFGVTFDVVADGLADTEEGRARLTKAVQNLKPNQSRTNLDEAAKGIEWVQFKLLAGNPKETFDHYVQVLTDNISSPSDEKPSFDLQKYLESHTRDGRMVVVQAQVEAEGQEIKHQPGGAIQVVPVDRVIELLRSRPETTPRAMKVPTPMRMPRYLVPVGSLLLLASIVLVIVRAMREDPDLKPLAVPHQQSTDVPASLEVSEYEIGGGGAPREKLLQEVRIPIRPSLPTVFGRNAYRSAFVVSAHKDLPEQELFRITAVPGRLLQIEAARGVLMGDNEVPENGVRVGASDLVRLRCGILEWRIRPSFQVAQADAGKSLFAAARAGS